MEGRMVALVTGCSSGFGRLTAETLARSGLVVYAGMRDVAGRNAGPAGELAALAGASDLPLQAIDLDVTSDASADEAAARIVDEAGRIDVLVNNAGIGSFGVTEAFTPDQALQLFDVNVVGALRMQRAVLPTMRAAGHGLLIQIGTSIARVPMPFMGVYCASKAAGEVLAEEARYVLAPLGIDSVIVQPAVYPTPMMQKMMQPADGARVGGYGPVMPLMGNLGKAMEWMLSSEPDPQEVADAVANLVAAEPGTRPLRTVVGGPHPPGTDELNQATDDAISAFYPMLGVADFLGLRT